MNPAPRRDAGDFGRLRLIARISLWFGALALVALLTLIQLASPVPGDYAAAIAQLSATREQLPLLMGVGGLLLAIGTALTTWLIAIYSSFRVAGPLHRFCIDLEQGIERGQVPRIRLRQSDHIQQDAQHLEAAISELYRRYDSIAEALALAEEALRPDGRPDAGALAHLQRARALAERVRT